MPPSSPPHAPKLLLSIPQPRSLTGAVNSSTDIMVLRVWAPPAAGSTALSLAPPGEQASGGERCAAQKLLSPPVEVGAVTEVGRVLMTLLVRGQLLNLRPLLSWQCVGWCPASCGCVPETSQSGFQLLQCFFLPFPCLFFPFIFIILCLSVH